MNRLGRRIGFVIVLVILAGFTFYIRGNPPLMAVASNSMQPTISRGDLILIREKSAYELQEGNIVVFDVPSAIQEQYHYPPIIAHRIIRVTTSGTGIALRTKGDNSGEDPFTVLPGQVRGTVDHQVPYLGYLVLYLQSQQGLIFIIAALFIYLVYSNSGALSQTGRRVRSTVFGVPAEGFEHRDTELMKNVQVFSLGVQQSLNQFGSAMGEYAQHIASHTDAIKAMAGASQDLRDAVREQNKMFRSWRGVGDEEGETRASQHMVSGMVSGCYREKRLGQYKPLPPGCWRLNQPSVEFRTKRPDKNETI